VKLAECDVEIVRGRECVLDIGEALAYRYRHAPAGTPREMVRAPRREEMPVREGHPRGRFPLTLGLTRGTHDFLAASPTRRKTRWALPPRIFPTSSGR
jgi:hypothetical protein